MLAKYIAQAKKLLWLIIVMFNDLATVCFTKDSFIKYLVKLAHIDER